MFLEHVNMSVANLERSIAFYQHLLGLRVRWRGATSTGEPAAHVGDERHYLALFEVGGDGNGEPDYEEVGLNHFGWVVDDLDAAKQRLAALQLQPHYEANYEPGRRLYFLDPDGIEVELVEYEKAKSKTTPENVFPDAKENPMISGDRLQGLRAAYDGAFRQWVWQLERSQSLNSAPTPDVAAVEEARQGVAQAEAAYRESRNLLTEFMMDGPSPNHVGSG